MTTIDDATLSSLSPHWVGTCIPLLLALHGPKALCAFFASKNAKELQEAGVLLATTFTMLPQAEGISTIDSSAWLEAEYAFNRLFVGPGPVVASPYASAHLSTEPQLMDKSTLEVRELLSALGLTVPLRGSAPDDHMAFELDAWVALCALGRSAESQEYFASVNEACHWLLVQHMGKWIPVFLQKALSEPEIPAPVLLALSALRYWLEETTAIFMHEKGETL